MFRQERCNPCGDCLADCPWIEVMMRGERAPAVDGCITCYASNETCPQGANLFDLAAAGIKFALGKGDPRPDQEKNLRDAKDAGARAMVCLCPMCIHALADVAREQEMPLIFLGDLARMALGEKEI